MDVLANLLSGKRRRQTGERLAVTLCDETGPDQAGRLCWSRRLSLSAVSADWQSPKGERGEEGRTSI